MNTHHAPKVHYGPGWEFYAGLGITKMEASDAKGLTRTLAYTYFRSLVQANEVMFKLPFGQFYLPAKLVSNSTKTLRWGGGALGLWNAYKIDKQHQN